MFSLNAINKSKNKSDKFKLFFRDISKYGVRKTRGFIINKRIVNTNYNKLFHNKC